ncbi:hypothetical protein L963_1431 [Leuconostoc mesenteroides subsp. cremoris T26]|nr:hypothetical protein L963_1431 [Leuconostoc mesenteroides subsp. cremoris T26]
MAIECVVLERRQVVRVPPIGRLVRRIPQSGLPTRPTLFDF